MDRRQLVDILSACLSSRGSSIACAYLFGSVARGEARPTSDIDLAVLFKQDPPSTLEGLGFDIAGDIERALGSPVDIVVLNRASPDLVHRVLRDGILVHESDPGARIRFETRKRAEYFDVLPYLKQYRRAAGRQHS
jgi:predicted nucleotidyltransferase